MKRLLPLLLALLLLGCAATQPVEPSVTPPTPTVEPTPEPMPEPLPLPEPEPDPMETLLSTLSVAEKVGQLFFVRVPADNQVADIATYHLGGYILFGRDTADQTVESLTQTLTSYQDAATIPLLIGVDEEGGTVVRVSSNPNLRSSKFQSPQKLYNAQGFDAIHADTTEKTQLLQSLGFNVNLAPVADVSTHASDFIYSRTLGQDAPTTGDYVSMVVSQMASYNMGSVLKHFPGYGDNVDTHTGIAVDKRPLEQFESCDLIPFQAGVTASSGDTAVLVSHNIITAVDDAYPASLSAPVHDWLRTALDFDGVVMTDDLAMDAVSAYAEDGNVSTLAILAGNDLVITSDYRTQIPKVLEAVENGTLPMERVDEACLRVLRWKEALELI